MLAEDKLRQGDVDEALAELKKAVQKDPSDAKYRVFLFQLLSVVGKWDSAVTQLEVAGELDPGTLAMVQAYREAIRCERDRREVFAGEMSPLIFGEPDRWLALLIQSLKHMAAGQYADAARLRDEALEEAPGTSGTIEVTGDHSAEFAWIADADSRFGPVLEVFMNGQYYWVPVHRIAEIDMEAPADLRDFVWTPAHFTWANGGQSVGLIPTRYPGAESDADPLIRLARKTDWQTVGDADAEAYLGMGQRMLATDAGEYSLLDIRKIVLQVVPESDDSQAATGSDG
jgi:type VI secretion system protein ImpE